MSNKIYPIGIQNFESLRQDGYFYIDKTALIYQLVKTGRYYFLSRPRRFGKSLLVSTLKAYFQGKKELFTGLAMEKLEKDWITYPILHIDLVLQTDKFIYIMEFKLEGTAEEALQQINDKRYALPFEADGRKLFKIGVNFSEKTRNIEKWVVE